MYKQLLFQGARLLLVISGLFSGYLIIKYTILFFYPFFIAAFFSVIINPFVTFIELRLKIPRALATLIVMVTMFVFLISSAFVLVTKLVQGTTYLAKIIPAHFEILITFAENIINTKLIPYYHKLTSIFNTLDPSQQITINEHIQQLTSEIASSGAMILQMTFLKLSAILSHLPNSITVIVITLLATFLITNDLNTIKKAVKKRMPSFVTVQSTNILIHLKKALGGFLRAQFILISLTGCIIFISMSILRIEHALTIALLATVTDLLPYIGTGIIFLPWIIYLFVTANYSMTINLLVIYMFIVISRQVFEPKIISANIGLHPLTALLALFIGLQLWGIMGVLIAPILLIVLKALQQAGVIKQLWEFVKG